MPRREQPQQERRRNHLREQLSDDRPRPVAGQCEADANGRADDGSRYLSELEPTELHLAYEQRLVSSAEGADEEADGDRSYEGRD